jgi:hypothetical protein
MTAVPGASGSDSSSQTVTEPGPSTDGVTIRPDNDEVGVLLEDDLVEARDPTAGPAQSRTDGQWSVANYLHNSML